MCFMFFHQLEWCNHKHEIIPINIYQKKKTSKHHRYKILCPKLLKDVAKPEVCAQIILTHIALPEENYRMGKTKVQCFNLMDRFKARKN